MGFRFRRSVRLFPGVRVNVSKSGLSLSVGQSGATVNFSSRGIYSTLGMPGTGMSWRQRLDAGNRETKQKPTHLDEPADIQSQPIRSLEELEAAIASPDGKLVYAESGRKLSDRQVEAARQRIAEKQ